MAPPPAAVTPISRSAFATLLLIALMMGANHVSARLGFTHGVDVATGGRRQLSWPPCCPAWGWWAIRRS